MKKSILFVCVFCFFLWADAKPRVYPLRATVANMEDGYVFLRDIWSGENIDTAYAEKGQFAFDFRVKEPV